jgi:hypothetical protein
MWCSKVSIEFSANQEDCELLICINPGQEGRVNHVRNIRREGLPAPVCLLCLCAYSHLPDQKLSFALLRQSPFTCFQWELSFLTIVNNHRLLSWVSMKFSPPRNSGFLFTAFVFLILSQYTNMHTHNDIHTQWVHSINVKYCTVFEFSNFYLVNSNFQQY